MKTYISNKQPLFNAPFILVIKTNEGTQEHPYRTIKEAVKDASSIARWYNWAEDMSATASVRKYRFVDNGEKSTSYWEYDEYCYYDANIA